MDVRFLTVVLAVSLMQSQVLGGINMSLADVVVLPLLLLLLIRGVSVPLVPVLLLIAVLVVATTVAMVMTPWQFEIVTSPVLVIRDAVKLLAAFVFFLLGWCLVQANLMSTLLRWYSIAAVFVGGIGGVWMLLNISFLREHLFFAGVRFQGLAEDPNLTAILVVAGLPYFLSGAVQGKLPKLLALGAVGSGVIASGSRTGLIVLLLYLSYMIIRSILATLKGPDAGRGLALAGIGALGLVVFALLGLAEYLDLAEVLGESRALEVLADPAAAFDGYESARSTAALGAVVIIGLSPWLGVGLGTYASVAEVVAGSPVLAHNTYLQLAAEWGIPLTAIFFALVFYLVATPRVVNFDKGLASVMSQVTIILLLGGLATSMNNVRIFWLCLGGLLAIRSLADMPKQSLRRSSRGMETMRER